MNQCCPRCGYDLSGAEHAAPVPLDQLRFEVRRNGGTVAPDDTVGAAAAAALLGRTVSTLNWWRQMGTGPAFVRQGRRVRYRLAALAAFLAEETRGAL